MEAFRAIFLLILILVGLVLAIFWIFFPILVYSRLGVLIQEQKIANHWLKQLVQYQLPPTPVYQQIETYEPIRTDAQDAAQSGENSGTN